MYFDSPEDVLLDGKRIYSQVDKFRVSPGFDPIRLEEGLGFGYTLYQNADESRKVSIMTGLGSRQSITRSLHKNDDDEDTPEVEYTTVEHDSEFGLEFVVDALMSINQYVKYSSYFVGFLGLDDELWRCRWDNSMEIMLGKYIGIGLTADVIYDESIFEGTQIRTGTLITLSYRVF